MLSRFCISTRLPDPTCANAPAGLNGCCTRRRPRRGRRALCPFGRLYAMPLNLLVRQRNSHRFLRRLRTHNGRRLVVKVVWIYFELRRCGQCKPQTRERDNQCSHYFPHCPSSFLWLICARRDEARAYDSAVARRFRPLPCELVRPTSQISASRR